MKNRLMIILGLLLIPAALFSQTVTLQFDQERQTILHNGINMEGLHWMPVVPPSLIATHEKMIKTLKCQLLRIGMPINFWEPVNDNASPADMNMAGFCDTGEMHRRFLYFKDLKARGYDLWLTPFDAPNWMVSNPTLTQSRLLNSTDEFVESIIAYLVHAKKAYGFEAKYLSLNEPSIGMLLNISAWTQVEIIKKLGPRLAAEGLSAKWIICSHLSDSSNLAYVKTVYGDPGVRPYVVGFDFHGYHLESKPATDSALSRWGRWTDSTGLFSLCGELDYNVSFWLATNPDSWTHASPTGRVFFKALNEGRSVGALPWYADAAETSRPYRYVAKHFQQYLTPGYQVCATASSSASILSLAAKKDSAFVVFLQNEGGAPASVTLQGLPPIKYAWVTSYNGHYFQYNGYVTPAAGQAVVALPAMSVNTLTPYDSTAPAASGLQGVPAGPYRIQLTWSRAFDAESDVIAYVVIRDGVRIDTLGPDTAFLDQGLKELTAYRYELRAVNGHGVEGGLSAPVLVSTDRDAAGPALVSVSARDSLSVVVTFSEAVDSVTARLTANYSAAPSVTWTGAFQEAPDRILLTPSVPLRPRSSFRLTVQAVKDASAGRNGMARPEVRIFAIPLVVVDFGASAAATFIGCPGFNVIKDNYTNYTALGPDGMHIAQYASGPYNFQGVATGGADSLLLKTGDRFEVHWYNDNTTTAAFTPRFSLTHAGRLSSAPAGSVFNMTSLSLPSKRSGTTSFTVTSALSGLRGIVNTGMVLDNSGTLVCDKILLFPLPDSLSMYSEGPGSGLETLTLSPNPFNPSLQIRYAAPDSRVASRNIRLRIVNGSGQLVCDRISRGNPGRGATLTWNAAGFPSGVYLVRLAVGDRVYNRKVVLVR